MIEEKALAAVKLMIAERKELVEWFHGLESELLSKMALDRITAIDKRTEEIVRLLIDKGNL